MNNSNKKQHICPFLFLHQEMLLSCEVPVVALFAFSYISKDDKMWHSAEESMGRRESAGQEPSAYTQQ